MNGNRIVLISAEKEVAELLREAGLHVLGFLDPLADAAVPGLSRLGDDSAWDDLVHRHPDLAYVLAIDPPRLKRRIAEAFSPERMLTVVSPAAHLSPAAQIGKGCVIQRGAVVMPDAAIGRGCKLNLGATVHHDCRVGDWCTIAPGARLLGNVAVGNGAYIGASATILPRVRVGAGAVIGAGATVVDDVPEGVTVAGVPARILKKDPE
jgi:acetyltransferase EpsM